MGFFKEFKEDFSDAVNELIPEEAAEETTEKEDVMVNTLDEDIDVESELTKLDGLLEQVAKKVDNNETITATKDSKEEVKAEEATKMDTNETVETMTQTTTPVVNTAVETDETAVITKGMKVTGDLESTGSIDIQGTIQGNISCSGKLVVTGTVNGNSASAEFFADAAKIEGEVNTSGTAKIGVGSVIIGNVTATSAVIAGAVKGDIDVQGPVVVDTSAVIMGNIKSRSVQINNGAVIEGFCSQCYADVDVQNVFN